MYPPRAQEQISTTISHNKALIRTVDGAAPTLDQGESDERLAPAPKAKRDKKSAALMKAPEIIAAQDTPEEDDSVLHCKWGLRCFNDELAMD